MTLIGGGAPAAVFTVVAELTAELRETPSVDMLRPFSTAALDWARVASWFTEASSTALSRFSPIVCEREDGAEAAGVQSEDTDKRV